MPQGVWKQCLERLEGELTAQQFNTWIRPLKVKAADDGICILAPNRFVLDWVSSRFLQRISEICQESGSKVKLDIASESAPEEQSPGAVTAPVAASTETRVAENPGETTTTLLKPSNMRRREDAPSVIRNTTLNPDFTFDNFVEGKSNQLARAAAVQVAENAGGAYNPLFLYGGVGLGKTHLMHAIGHHILSKNPKAKVAYLHSERFVQDMVKALQQNAINRFKGYYRSLDALLIDDIQFFAGKERSQEEFFHTFNALLEGQRQVVLTCDRYPKEVNGLEERLKSRFGWGLTVCVEPPELETRVAILMSKANFLDVHVPDEVAFFIAKRIRSNIRELEGALRRVVANARFKGVPITVEFTKEALRDLLALQARLVTVENIQKTVIEYYKLRRGDLLSKSRSRSIARPRQIAMALSKELTNHSLPEIGQAFGGRDHTTVLHACKKVDELRRSDAKIEEDYERLLRILST